MPSRDDAWDTEPGHTEFRVVDSLATNEQPKTSKGGSGRQKSLRIERGLTRASASDNIYYEYVEP